MYWYTIFQGGHLQAVLGKPISENQEIAASSLIG